MTNPSRDLALDYLKGFACLLMTVAHLPVADKTDTAAVGFHYFAEYATVVFFAVSGMNAFTQAKKYSLRYLLALNAAIFVFGSPYSTVIHADLYGRYVLEILQIIAIGSLAVVLVQRFLGESKWIFAGVALAVMLGKVLRDLCWPELHGGGVLFVHEAYVPRAQLEAHGSKIFPGFPLFPWLAYFLWGVFAYALSQRAQGLLIAVLVAVYGAGNHWGMLGDFHEKWDTSAAYQVLSLLMLSVSLLLARAVPGHWLQIPRWVPYFGKNSLAFLYAHGFGLLAGLLVAKLLGQFPAWLTAIAITWIGLQLLQKWRGLKVFRQPLPWLLMGTIGLLLPLAIRLWPASYAPALLINLVMGLLIAKHFSYLRDLLRHHTTQPETENVSVPITAPSRAPASTSDG